MSERIGTIESLSLEIGKIFSPLERKLSSDNILPFLNELGIEFPDTLLDNAALTNALNQSIAHSTSLIARITDLIDAIEAEEKSRILNISVEIIKEVERLIVDIKQIETAVSGLSFPEIPPQEIIDFAAGLVKKFLDYLIVSYLDEYHSLVYAVFSFLGIVEKKLVPFNEAFPFKPSHYQRTIHYDRIPRWFQDPGVLFSEIYEWGSPGFTGEKLLESIRDVLVGLSVPVVLQKPVDDDDGNSLVFGLFRLRPNRSFTPPGIDATIFGEISQAYSIEIPIWGDFLHFLLEVEGGLSAETGFRILPPFRFEAIPPSGSLSGRLGIGLIGKKNDGSPLIIVGNPSGSRWETLETGLKMGAGFIWNISNGAAEGNIGFEAYMRGAKIVVSVDESDGFLHTIFQDGFEAGFDIGVGYNSSSGFFFTGSATLEIQIPAHIALGPIEIDALTIQFVLQGSQFPLNVSGNISGILGPLQFVVEGIGFSSIFSFPPQGGNIGPMNVALGFKPPNGVGLSIDAGVITGGGYLFFDFDREEYAGVLQLDISGFVTINAIGMITTKMPDGSKGFSLLVIMTVEFNPGIQLGFGFTFIGIGGLLGLNRTVMLEVLAQGIRNGTLNNIMFPQGDIIANAPRIISDLRAIFPPEEGKFLVGPMVKLGWGSPTLISLAIGVIIEIPGNFAIVGVLKVALPTADAPLIIIQVAFIGAVEFDKKRLWFFASMFESRIIFITLEGEMGVLVAWGDDANFVVSVGGFHPRFNPPPLPFPSPRRIALDLSNNPAYQVRIEGYFAVTSNTVQFGARAELRFGLDDFGIQGHIAFDALFQFSPFYFIIEISASVSLRVFGFDCFSIRLEFSLEGPTPYRARGTGYISILFWEFSADFDVTWGESQDTSLPPIEVMPLLKAEFEKIENWKAELPAGSNLLVSLRPLNAAIDLLVMHPVGVLRISQRAIPLDLSLDKVGSQNTTGAKKFSVSVTTSNLGLKGKVDEQFAIAQFQNMTDAEKLSRPSYQPNPGGLDISVSGNQLKTSGTVKRIVRYEMIIIDTNYKRFVRKFFQFTSSLFYHFFLGSAVTKSVLSQDYKQQRKPYAEAVALLPDHHVVAFSSNNAAFSEQAVFASEALAREYMNTQVAASPELGEQLHVIPQFETFSAS